MVFEERKEYVVILIRTEIGVESPLTERLCGISYHTLFCSSRVIKHLGVVFD